MVLRRQVQIAAKGLLAERVKQSPNGMRTLSFWTKLFAPLGKAWRKLPQLGQLHMGSEWIWMDHMGGEENVHQPASL